MRFPKLTADRLEQQGQLRLPFVDVLRKLVQPLAVLVIAVKKALGLRKASLAPRITETARSISVRLTGALLTISGDDRDFLDAGGVQAAIADCKGDTDCMDVLEGMGFACRMVGHQAAAVDAELLDDNSNDEFAFA